MWQKNLNLNQRLKRLGTHGGNSFKFIFAFCLFIYVMHFLANHEKAIIKIIPTLDWDLNWARFMKRTLFEGQGIGGSDFGVCFLILLGLGVLFWDLTSFRKTAARFFALRTKAGLLFVYGVGVSVAFVQSLKWGLGRARPYLFLENPELYSDWHSFGKISSAVGNVNGSFPSGHVGAVMVLFAAVECALPKHVQTPRRVFLRIFGLMVALMPPVLMGFSRVAIGDHWPTDTWASLSFGLLFWSYLSSEPSQAVQNHTHQIQPARFLEYQICFVMLGLSQCLNLFVWNFKALVQQGNLHSVYAMLALFGLGTLVTKITLSLFNRLRAQHLRFSKMKLKNL